MEKENVIMGDLNQLKYLKDNAHLVKGPILEIGSKDYGNNPNYRVMFPDKSYVGIDLENGKGVDAVIDLSINYEKIISKLKIDKFNTVICFSVLEHCKDLFKVCSNIQKLLNPRGHLFISVPFCWEYHRFPEDYWRFTPEGIKILFPDFEFVDNHTMISTSKIGEIKSPDNEFYKLDMAPRVGIQKKRYSLFAGIVIKIFKYFPFLKPIFDYTFLMPPVAVQMVGIKKGSSPSLLKDE